MKNRVVAIVLNYLKWQDTLDCIDAVLRGTLAPSHIIVIENGSKNDSLQQLQKELPKRGKFTCLEPSSQKNINSFEDTLILIPSSENLGFTGGNNLGIEFTMENFDFDFIWLLNNDCIPDRIALEKLVNLASSDPMVGAVGSKLLFFSSPNIIQAAGGGKIYPERGMVKEVGYGEEDLGQWDKQIALDYISGASMLIRKEALIEAGMFYPEYFLYWEDADLSLQIARKGFKLGYAWDSKIWHKHPLSARPNPLADYYFTKNQYLFLKRNYPTNAWIRTARRAFLRFGKRILNGQWENACAVWKGFLEGAIKVPSEQR